MEKLKIKLKSILLNNDTKRELLTTRFNYFCTIRYDLKINNFFFLKKLKLKKLSYKKPKKYINFLNKVMNSKSSEEVKLYSFSYLFYLFYWYWIYFFLGLGYTRSINFLLVKNVTLNVSNLFSFFFFKNLSKIQLKFYNFFIFYQPGLSVLKNKKIKKFRKKKRAKKKLKWKIKNRDYKFRWKKKQNKRLVKIKKKIFKKTLSKSALAVSILSTKNNYEFSKKLLKFFKYKYDIKINLYNTKKIKKNKKIKKSKIKLKITKEVKQKKTIPVLFQSLINFYCSTFFKRNCIILPFNYFWTRAYRAGHIRGFSCFKRNRFLKSIFFSQRLLAALFISIKFRDSCLFTPMLQDMFEFVHYKKHRKLFFFCKWLMHIVSTRFLPKANILGISLYFFGKLGVGGNSRKRAYKFKYGLASNSTKLLKIDYSHLYFRTETGVVGFTYSVFY